MLKKVMCFLVVIGVFCFGYILGTMDDGNSIVPTATAIEYNNAPKNIGCPNKDKIKISCWEEYGNKYYKISWNYLPGYSYEKHQYKSAMIYLKKQ